MQTFDHNLTHLFCLFHDIICLVLASNPIPEETPKEEAPEPVKEEKEMTLEEGKKKKNLFGSLFSSCFGGKSQVVEKPEVQEQAKPKEGEAEKPAEEDPAKDEPAENKAAEEEPAANEKEEWTWGLQFNLWKHTIDTEVKLSRDLSICQSNGFAVDFQVVMLKLSKSRI